MYNKICVQNKIKHWIWYFLSQFRLPLCIKLIPWQIHGKHTYFVSIKVENVAGLSSVQPSPAYVHIVGKPRAGIVIEVPLATNDTTTGQLKVSDFYGNIGTSIVLTPSEEIIKYFWRYSFRCISEYAIRKPSI